VKTIVHIELSDEDRNDLAKRLSRNPADKHLVSRKEVTEFVHSLIHQEIEDGRNQEKEDAVEQTSDGKLRRSSGQERPSGDDPAAPDMGRLSQVAAFVASRGDEEYLAQPKDPGIAAACSRILDDTALIDAFVWETVDKNRKT